MRIILVAVLVCGVGCKKEAAEGGAPTAVATRDAAPPQIGTVRGGLVGAHVKGSRREGATPLECWESRLTAKREVRSRAEKEALVAWATEYVDQAKADIDAQPMKFTMDSSCTENIAGPVASCTRSRTVDAPAGVEATVETVTFAYAAGPLAADECQNGTWTDLTVPVTARELYAAYDENEISADNAYQGKALRISGEVRAVTKSGYPEKPTVELVGDDVMGRVYCSLAPDQAEAAAQLKKGAMVTLLAVGSSSRFSGPELQRCRVE